MPTSHQHPKTQIILDPAKMKADSAQLRSERISAELLATVATGAFGGLAVHMFGERGAALAVAQPSRVALGVIGGAGIGFVLRHFFPTAGEERNRLIDHISTSTDPNQGLMDILNQLQYARDHGGHAL